MPRPILTPLFIMATLVTAPTGPTGGFSSGLSATGQVEATKSDLYSFDFEHGDVSGWVTVRKTHSGLAVVVHATGLTPGHVYVLRNRTAHDADGSQDTYLSGNVVGEHGATTFLAHFKQPVSPNDSARWLPRLMLGDAGAAVPGEISRQLLGLTGPCAPSSPECFRLFELGGSQ